MRTAVTSLTILVLVLLPLKIVSQVSPLLQAVKDRDTVTVLKLAGAGESLNSADGEGRTALHWAVELNEVSLAGQLIKLGADINLTDNLGQAPLHVAAASGNVELAELLLAKGTTCLNDTTFVRHGGSAGQWTPLHLACRNGHAEMARLLLEHGANLEMRDGFQRTPLIITGQSNNAQTAEILVAYGADINAVAIRNYTALLWAARNNLEPMVNFLIGQKAGIADEMLPLAFQLSVLNGLDSLYQYVRVLGIDVGEMVADDPEFLVPAAGGGSAMIVKALLDLGLEPNQADEDGWTPLHYAAAGGHTAVVEALLDAGADINARTLKGEAAYNFSDMHNDTDTRAVLAARGSDISEPLFPTFEGPYMGQSPPGDTPQIFMPGIVSAHDRAHSSITFSPDGIEALWTEMAPPEGAVRFSKIENGRWTYPTMAEIDRDPTYSPDGNRVYFIQTRPFEPGEIPGGDPDVKEEYWYKERTDTGWSEPKSVGEEVNKIGVHWPCSIDREGNLYFSEFARNMYCSKLIDGVYKEPTLLTTLFDNETLIGRSPFISPDGDYLLFSSDSGIGVSFRGEDGRWTDFISLGSTINASHENGCPRVTADGKYLFFVSSGKGRPWGIYWVSAGVIDSLREEHLDL